LGALTGVAPKIFTYAVGDGHRLLMHTFYRGMDYGMYM